MGEEVSRVQRVGHWIQTDLREGRCSLCGSTVRTNGYDRTGKALILHAIHPRCLNCGAKMVRPEENKIKII